MTETPLKVVYKVSLDCGDTVYTDVKLRLQYSSDEHYILCPECEIKKASDGHLYIPTAWQHVTGMEEVNVNDLRDVSEWVNRIMPDRILRLQPSVPRSRVRPFPYINGRL